MEKLDVFRAKRGIEKVILLIILFTVSLFLGCSNSVSKGKKVDYIEVVELTDNKKWTLLENDEVDKFIKALDNKEKVNGKFDIRTPDYSVNIYFKNKSSKSYSLWLGEDINMRGIIMDEDKAWYINKNQILF